MSTFLLLIIFVLYIGLGLPDSLFGAAWPAIFPDLGVSAGSGTLVTIPIFTCTFLSCALAGKVINRFGTGTVVAVSTLLSCLALLGFSLSHSFILLIVFAIPLGFGAGSIDAAMNNYVALHYKSYHMGFLHCFYGIGVLLSPILVSLSLSNDNDWRGGYMKVFILMAALSVIAFASLPVWKKANKGFKKIEQTAEMRSLSFKSMLSCSAIRISWVMFFSTCALEFTCGVWGATYLVGAEGVLESTGALLVTLYYAGIVIGRLVSAILSTKIKNMPIVFAGYSFVALAIVLMFLPLPATVKGVALFLVGFGNGPSFPNLIYLTPKIFGKDVSSSIVGTQMAAANLGILLVPPVFGLLADAAITFFPAFLLVLLAVMVYSTVRYSILTKNQVILP